METAARIAGLPVEQAEVIVDHLQRVGMLISAAKTAGSTGCVEGACSTSEELLSDEQRLHCAGCPLW